MNVHTDRFEGMEALDAAAVAHHRRRLAEDPDSPKDLLALGHLLRKQGSLEEAAQCFAQVPDDAEARWLQSVLTGAPTKPPPDDRAWPARFLHYSDFMPSDWEQALFASIEGEPEMFEAATVYDHATRTRKRSDTRRQTIRDLPEELASTFHAQVQDRMPEIAERMNLDRPAIAKKPRGLARTGDGDYGGIHNDDLNGLLNYVYYYFRQPKAFEGADLLLYDTHHQSESYLPSQFTKLTCQSNTLVVFPSWTYHAITKARCPGDAFTDGRFAIAGAIG